MNLPLYLYFLIPCILAGVSVYFQKSSPLYLRLFPVLLTINLILEIVGQWVLKEFGTNVTLFNFYMAFELTAHLLLLREMVVGRTIKRIVFYLVLIYPVICIINIFFIQGLGNWHSISYGIGNILIVGLAIYYFFELFKRPNSINLMREPAFWICSALLFYYMCSFPFLSLANFIVNAPVVILNNFSFILNVLNILQYTLFTIAFLCRVRSQKGFSNKLA